jgi:prepilin-type N-terminal cleavage/methylation domain-containing protein
MKNNKGFTLIELVAVIILVGLIALIITPKITKVLKTQKMNIFKDSVEGIVKAIKEDAVNNAGFNSTTTSNYRAYIYDGEGLYLTVAGNKTADADIKISGNIDNGQGTVVVTKDSNVVLAVYNDKFCAKKNADDTSVTVEEYSGTCVNDEIDIPEATSCFTYENNPDNTLTITGYRYNDATCSKDLVIPNRINGKLVSKLADLAFVDAEVVITKYMELDINGDPHWYGEFLENFPSDKQMEWMTLTSNINVTGKYCYTDIDENNSVDVGLNYIHTTGDGYYSCYYNYSDQNLIDKNNYQFNSINFSNATGLTEIPFGLMSYSSIKSINLGNYVTSVNKFAFSDNFLTNVTIPSNLVTISPYAFFENKISNLDFTNATALKHVGEGAFAKNVLSTVKLENLNNLVDIDGGYWGAFEDNVLTSVTLRNLPNLTNIGTLDDDYGPFNYNNITTLSFENLPNLRTIGSDAFRGNNLTSVTIPTSIEFIGNYSFDRCSCADKPSNPALATIINQTGKSFDWSLVIGEGTTATCSFITGTCSAVNITN